MPGNEGRKLAIIGLDGASFRFIKPLIEQNKLPNIAKLMRNGSFGALRSTIPPITACAWLSFMTGKNPANHGAFDFRTYNLHKYSCYDEEFVNSADFRGTTIFDFLSAENKSVCAIKVPLTYPPWKINGIMVSGYPAPTKGAIVTYPPELNGEINKNFRLQGNPHYDSKYTFEIAMHAIEKINPELLCVVFSEIDWIEHWHWGKKDNEIEHAYITADGMIGRIIDALPDADFVIMSDHGAGATPPHNFNTNYFLRQIGLLDAKGKGKIAKVAGNLTFLGVVAFTEFARSFKDAIKRFLPKGMQEGISATMQSTSSINWANTKAYRVPMYLADGIEINLKGRQPLGIVEKGEYEELRNKIIAELKNARNPKTNEPIVKEIYKKEEVYSGKYIESRTPDIVFLYNENYMGGSALDGLISKTPWFLRRRIPGGHAMDGIFIASGAGIKANNEISGAKIEDVAPTVLHMLNMPVDEGMDGRALEEIFENKREIKKKKYGTEGGGAEAKLSAQDEEAVKQRLKALGYM
ncbi:MAG: alkaline phosphatase family protein [Candidatus Diapherotrites archaeon]|nr:alkaline phosphatase family protein [Candidatus Diapherotrites archaeon]